MNEKQKYGIIAILAVFALSASHAADISDYLSGIILGISVTIMLFAIYKIVSRKRDDEEEAE